MNDTDLQFLRQAIRVAQPARDKSNHPFGAVFVDEHGVRRSRGKSVWSRD